MAYKNGVGTKLQVDIDETGTTPDLKDLCVLNVDESLGEVVDTWRELCKNGKSTSQIVALEESIAWTLKFNDKEDGAVYLYSIRKDIELRNDRKFILIDGLTDDTYEMVGTIGEISHTKEVDTITEISFNFMINEETFTPFGG